jgi:hypothetical protein
MLVRVDGNVVPHRVQPRDVVERVRDSIHPVFDAPRGVRLPEINSYEPEVHLSDHTVLLNGLNRPEVVASAAGKLTEFTNLLPAVSVNGGRAGPGGRCPLWLAETVDLHRCQEVYSGGDSLAYT